MDRAFQRSHSLMLRGTFYSVPPNLFTATDMQAHHPSKRVSFCGRLGLIREKEGQIQLMYLGCGRSLKKGNFVLESDHDVYAAIYMQHGV